jgi:large subunit ribosomal protein L1
LHHERRLMALSKKEVKEQLEALGVEFDHSSPVSDLRHLLAQNQPVEEPVTEEQDVTAAAKEAAEQEESIIIDKQGEETGETVAKAGKRSTKALKEAAEKEAKTARKETTETESKPSVPVKPARSKLERRGKQFRKSAENIEAGKSYDLKQAVELAQKTSHVKFDATVELHINLSVDPRHADQNIRDNLVLPAGTGKTVRIAVADDDLLAKLDKGDIDFDVLIATPDFMPKLGKYARVLGPKGLMPNPKSGTVTTDIDKAVTEAKAGRVEYRVDSTGIVHLGVGKVSFTASQLLDNVQAVFTSVKNNKPASVKSNYIKAAYLATSMGPSIVIDLASIV